MSTGSTPAASETSATWPEKSGLAAARTLTWDEPEGLAPRGTVLVLPGRDTGALLAPRLVALSPPTGKDSP